MEIDSASGGAKELTVVPLAEALLLVTDSFGHGRVAIAVARA